MRHDGKDPTLTYRNHGTTCKFCKKPITLEVAEIYLECGDPHKLFPMACCDWCSDIRHERDRIEAKIASAARNVSLSGPNSKERETLRTVIERLTQAYAEFVCKWHHRQGSVWDAESVELIMDKPEHWQSVLGMFWKLYRDWEKKQEVA